MYLPDSIMYHELALLKANPSAAALYTYLIRCRVEWAKEVVIIAMVQGSTLSGVGGCGDFTILLLAEDI